VKLPGPTRLVSRAWPVQTAMRNCTRDEGGPFEVGNQVLISSHRKLLSSKEMVVNVAVSTKQPRSGSTLQGRLPSGDPTERADRRDRR
jgi:hypothetical protein